MAVSRWSCWLTSGLLLLGAGVGPRGARAQSGLKELPALEGPAVGAELKPETPQVGTAAPETGGPLHEAFQAPGARAVPVRAPKSPPPPIAEQPTNDRPGTEAQWVGGYWAWDPARNDFAWVAGTWRVPPRDAIWVNGRWRRDDDGWYRVPGFWSRRRDFAATVATTNWPGWRTTGPPTEHPDDTPPPAPGADFFFVPGHYTPDGDHVAWTPGIWARMQPGRDWVPARWVRRPDGWDFREGYWTRDPAAANLRRHAVAPPAPADDASDLPPPIVESAPAGPNASTDRLAPPRTKTGRDLLDEAEEGARARIPAEIAPDVYPPVVVVPRSGRYSVPYSMGGPPLGNGYGMPFRVIRPPGSFPYGPAGVVVPAAVPPFVQRLLNRVLP